MCKFIFIDKGITYLLFLLGLLLSIHSYSRAFAKKLEWKTSDSVKNVVFYSKQKINEWCENQLPFPTLYSKEVFIKNQSIYIAIIAGCSGLSCWEIYIFRREEKYWQLLMNSNIRLADQIEVEVKNDIEKIVFKTKNGLISELPFSVFNPN